MLRPLVDAVPTGLLILVGSALAVVVGLAVLRAVRSRWSHLQNGSHNDATNGVLTVAGTLYAIVIGFVILDAYSGIAVADAAVRSEASQVAQLLEDTSGMPGLADRVRDDIGGYVRHVVTEEWRQMQAGEDADLREPHLIDLFAAFKAFTPADDTQRAFYAEGLHHLNEIVDARRARLAAATQELPGALQGLLVGGALLIVLLGITLAVESRRIHAVLIAGLTALMASSVLLALALDFPFSGDFRVTDAAFRSGVLADFFTR